MPDLQLPPRTPRRDERGNALSALVGVVVMALLLVAGLVVDGGAKASALREAQVVASEAARAATDAGAVQRAAGQGVDIAAVRAAGQRRLADAGLPGSVEVAAGEVRVSVRSSRPTVFLSLLGVRELTATGEATASLRR